jgi:hypothetical protein
MRQRERAIINKLWPLGLAILALVVPACGGTTITTSSGITITDISPRANTFTSGAWSAPAGWRQSPSGRTLSLAVAADGRRLYAGSYAGVWRSDDAGATWRQMTRPQPPVDQTNVPGALAVPDVWDVVVSPADNNLVLAATANDSRVQSKNGIYRSTDGGETWSLAHQFACPNGGPVGQVMFAPDDPNLVYAAGGCKLGISTNSGQSWQERTLSHTVWHVAAAPLQGSVRTVYAAGDSAISRSSDGGQVWTRDLGAAVIGRGFAGPAFDCCYMFHNSASAVLAVEPGNPDHVYLALPDGANGPSYYAPPEYNDPDGVTCRSRGCGEGSLWFGDFSNFGTSRAAVWTQLPGPPVYFGNTTPSGSVYVVTKVTRSGYLLFFADESHVHVSMGKPTASASWHRLDGRDASQSSLDGDFQNKTFVHPDPHALAVSPDLDFTLRPVTGVPDPYNKNSVLAFCGEPDNPHCGTIWQANDGGVFRSTDGGQSWQPANGLTTLAVGHMAGAATANGGSPGLYFGTGDNAEFYTLSGGTRWEESPVGCGDCGPWFSDPGAPSFVLTPAPGPAFDVFYRPSSQPAGPPDASNQANVWRVPFPAGATNVDGSQDLWGNRPLILTTASDSPQAAPYGDLVLIRTLPDGRLILVRTNRLSQITSQQQWDDPAYAQQVGPALPPGVDVVQAAGGHITPTFYVGDPRQSGGVWKWTSGMPAWTQIVGPVLSVPHALRFFADPYDANVLYVVSDNGVRRSDDGGQTWQRDTSLDRAVTENGTFAYTAGLIQDMVFSQREPGTRFAVGNAGAYYTLNGRDWFWLLSTTALPGHPVSAFFDPVSNPSDRALYVAFAGRSVLRLGKIPRPDTTCATNPRAC